MNDRFRHVHSRSTLNVISWVGACLALALIARTEATQDEAQQAPFEEQDHDHAAEQAAALGAIPDHVVSREGFDFSIWETLPIQDGGLEKSLYTFAREFVRETVGTIQYEGRHPIETYFSMVFEPVLWLEEPFLKVRLPELKEAIGVEGHQAVTPLHIESKQPEWSKLAETTPEAEKELSALFNKTYMIVGAHEENFQMDSAAERMRVVPAVDFEGKKIQWRTIDQLGGQTKNKTKDVEAIVAGLDGVRWAFLRNDEGAFANASAETIAALDAYKVDRFKPAWKFKLDRWDSKVGLFRASGWIYLASALIFLAAYLWGQAKKPFWITGSALLGLGAATNVAALVIRGILAERTPVANLYESAVFITCGVAVFSLIISLYYRTRVVGLAGASLGAFAMGVANSMPAHYGTKILPLIDALQSYWLRIHVTSMLISYSLLSIAAFVAAAYIARNAVMKRREGYSPGEDETLRYLDSLNFRIVTIAMPVLTGGVILGAVWAAEAWGRPWAFDPKETAIALTWIVYALYLHCRLFLGWRGMRGIVFSLAGYAFVIFTYVGVSFFLPGLHSYVSEGVSFTEFLKSIIPGI